MSSQETQTELDFSREEQKLNIVNAIQDKIQQIDGPITMKHFGLLIEHACKDALDGGLADEKAEAINAYVSGLELRMDLDAMRIVSIIFPEEEIETAA